MAKKIIIAGIVTLPLSVFAFELLDGSRWGKLCFLFLVVAFLGSIFFSLATLAVKSLGWRWKIAGLVMAAFALSWVVASFSPGGNRTISKVTCPDGSELYLEQKKNDSLGEPYTISFYCKKPGQPAKWFYYDHQDQRWWFGHIELNSDGTRATVRRFILPVAYFDIQHEQFSLVRRESHLP
jgi:hypothetical protein